MKKYDFIIVGAGPSGIFAAYELKKSNPKLNILVLEKGKSIKKRVCPKRKTYSCVDCYPCNITTGFSGAGAFSDGKLSLNDHGEVGGNLINYIGKENYVKTLKETDDIYLKFGADEKVYGNSSDAEIAEIKEKAIKCNLKLIETGVRHLGTEKAFEIYSKIQDELENLGVEIKFETPVKDFIVENGEALGVECEGSKYYADKIVASVGREGCAWLNEICDRHNVKTEPGVIDIGVRVECDSAITKKIDDISYESKLVHYTKTFDDKVRTFCWNPRGEVSEERYDGNLALANGHSYKDEKYKTSNTNLALLVSKNFTEPFKTPIDYGVHVARLANMLAGGKVLVQTFGDFKRGRRTTQKRLERNITEPTLKDAVPGDLSLVLPYRIMLAIKEMIESLDKLMPGFASDGTLLYGVEVKFYSNKIKLNEKFETSVKNLYALGDGAGVTRGLMQASMNGMYFAKNIKKEK